MSEFNKLLFDQYEVGKALDKALTNFKKDGASRYTETYLVEKIKNVKTYWTSLKSNHEALRLRVEFPVSRYGTEREFAKFSVLTKDFMTRVCDELAKIPSYLTSDPGIVNAAKIFEGEMIQWESDLEGRAALMASKDKENIQPTNNNIQGGTTTASACSGQPTFTVTQAGSFGNNDVAVTPLANPPAPFVWANDVEDEERVQSFHLHVNLPKMEIPKFDGDIRKWRTFHDMFSKLVHEKQQISEIEKFTYLRTYLEGEPLALLAHLQVSAATYAIAWQTLISRYNNVRALIDAEIDFLLEPLKERNNSSIRTLHDSTRETLYNLSALGCQVAAWDPILVRITMRKMDAKSIDAFEDTLSDTKEVPELETLLKFLEKRFQKLDQVKLILPGKSQQKFGTNERVRANAANTSAAKSVSCFLCKGSHPLYKCERFLKLSAPERLSYAQKESLCVNCLSHKKNGNCKSAYRCKTCNKFHHNLLHLESRQATKISGNHSVTSSPSVLPTALILVSGKSGYQFKLRALIDSGSQASFISREAAHLVQAQLKRASVIISGVGMEGTVKSNCKAKIQLRSRVDDSFVLNTEACVLPSLTGFLPGPSKGATAEWMNGDCPTPLADPTAENVVDVDLVLGSDCFSSILRTNAYIKTSVDNFAALPTVFGWVIQGKGQGKMSRNVSVNTLTTDESTLHELWELPKEANDVKEKELAFTFEIASDGKFVVKYPFKVDAKLLGDSRRKALARFFSIERMLKRNPKMREQYVEFMNEYIDLNHMTLAKNYAEPGEVEYFIPHHPVVKEDSLTTKTRVVFDGSAKGDLGYSVNDVLHTGPLLLNNLWEILLRFRMNEVAFVADVAKMYRQIWIHPTHRKYQKIFWRSDPTETVKEYELNTVTYGIAPSPYLAIACLKQIAQDNLEKYPRSSKIVEDDSYVDDVISGDSSVEEVKQRVKEITGMLLERGFPLKKWACSHPEALTDLPEDDRVEHFLEIGDGKDNSVKTLGIEWVYSRDVFRINVKDELPPCLTKRSLLSFVARVFDPMGWLSPVLIRAKLLIQEAWQLKLDWDVQVPDEIGTKFLSLYSDIGKLKALEIPRFCEFSRDFSLLGFCDASGKAHGAVVYIKVPGAVYLVTSKSKVNPIREKQTLPRLELLGAVLLAQLIAAVKAALPHEPRSIHCFTDSEIVLCWLSNPALKFKVFVGARVEKIIALTGRECWRHVRSEENIADVVSRGTTTDKFLELSAWWSGPEWASRDVSEFPNKEINVISTNHLSTIELVESDDERMNSSDDVETLSVHIALSVNIEFDARQLQLINKIDSWLKLVRIIAYCLRVGVREKASHLTVPELRRGEERIVQLVQRVSFEEYHTLLKKKEILTGSLRSLSPFLDENGVMRVGGRLQNSRLPYGQKHPMILPKHHHVTTLLVRFAHAFTLHGAISEVMAFLRQKYWIVGMKDAVRKEVSKCMTCVPYSAKPLGQQMGSLPAVRVTPAAAFQNTGIDFAGPLKIRANMLRRATVLKAYLCIFVCLVTKAIHIEVVSDLTTKAFMAALKRFFARRGYCNHIYSDNGKTFLGAKGKLSEEERALQGFFENQLCGELAKFSVQWHFIPPYSAWFGGLWEAGVKSTKYHLKRMTDQLLTFEELTTIVTQIEGILNSRPLCPMSDDPTDLEYLTPAHFLIGRILNMLPERELPVEKISSVDRFKRCQIRVQEFWKKWSGEYLSRLQQKPKWLGGQSNLQVGDLVLIREEFLPVANWRRARVSECHPGKDGLVRVVTLFDGVKTFKRPIRLLSKLPVDSAEEIPLPIDEIPSVDRSKASRTEKRRKTVDVPVKMPVSRSSSSDKETKSAPKDSMSAIKRVSFQLPTSTNDDAAQPKLRRSYRIQKQGTKVNLIFLCLSVLMVFTPSDALFKNSPVEANGMFIHHKKTAIPTKGKSSLVYTSDLWVSKVSEQLNDTINTFDKTCRLMPDPKTWGFCRNATQELRQYFDEFESKREDCGRRVKRSKGLLGNILHTLKVFFFGSSSDEIEAKEEADFDRLGETMGNMMIDAMKTKQKLVSRDQAVQREFSHLHQQISERSDKTRVHVYLNQAFATIVRLMDHALVVFEATPRLTRAQSREMHEYVQGVIPNQVVTTDQLIRVSEWTLVDLEPLTYIQTFPLLNDEVFEELMLVPIPDFRKGTIALIKDSEAFISIKGSQYIVGRDYNRVAINETTDLIMEPTEIRKLTASTSCAIKRVLVKESCVLELTPLQKNVDEWIALSNGEVLYMSESFANYTITCDDGVKSLKFPVGVVTADNCVIENSERIIQTNAHSIDTGHGYHYHVPIKFFEPSVPVAENTTENFATLAPIELDIDDTNNMWQHLMKPKHDTIMKGIDIFLSLLTLILILGGVVMWKLKRNRVPTLPSLQNIPLQTVA